MLSGGKEDKWEGFVIVSGVALFVVLIGLLCFVVGSASMQDSMQKQAIAAKVAEYNPQTGEFQFIENK